MLVLATGNQHKREEILVLLADLPISVLTLSDFPDAPIIVEDGTTCEENAIKKAQGIAQYTGYVTIADDTGLEVEALDGKPGVHSARFAGESKNDADNITLLIKRLDRKTNRKAVFRTVMAFRLEGKTHYFEGNNLVLVDEGHRGTGTAAGAWMQRREALVRGGFAFEYSATFGQAVAKGNTVAKAEEEILKKKAKTLFETAALKKLVPK